MASNVYVGPSANIYINYFKNNQFCRKITPITFALLYF